MRLDFFLVHNGLKIMNFNNSENCFCIMRRYRSHVKLDFKRPSACEKLFWDYLVPMENGVQHGVPNDLLDVKMDKWITVEVLV